MSVTDRIPAHIAHFDEMVALVAKLKQFAPGTVAHNAARQAIADLKAQYALDGGTPGALDDIEKW